MIKPAIALLLLLPAWMLIAAAPSSTSPSNGIPDLALDPSKQVPRSAFRVSNSPFNPHWRADGCNVCHELEAGRLAPVQRADVDLLCLSCHDGKSATSEPHPIGRTFQSDQVQQPADWPTVDGKLTCLTCHDVLMGCKDQPRRAAANPHFLRGAQPMAPEAFCATCHVADLHQRFNPHVMLDESSNPVETACAACHTGNGLPRERVNREHRPQLLADEPTLCGRCHANHVDYFTPGHIGIRASHAVVTSLLRAEVESGGRNVSTPVRMPLADGHTVVCSTCHNPHQAGLFPPDSPLGAGAIATPLIRSDPVSLRVSADELCIHCHGK